jgi:hypothetical protein
MSFSIQPRLIVSALTAFGLLGVYLSAQDPQVMLAQRLTEIKASLANNQQALRQYSWTETTLVSLKGEEKVRQQHECRYGPDGKVAKTLVGAPPESGGKKKRGVKGKIVDKKVGELKEYMGRAASLIQRYVPPDPARMKSAFDTGKAALSRNAADSSTTVEFKDYFKPGDSLILSMANGQVKSVAVKSYLDDASDAVSLNAAFQLLADGTNYMAESVLDATAKQVQIRTTNFDHKKVAGQ